MPQISLFKTIAKFLTGAKRVPKELLRKHAEKKAILQGRFKDCDDLLTSLAPIVNAVPGNQKAGIEKEYMALQNDFNYVLKHFKSQSLELDRRLEVIILKARTLKIQAACMSCIDQGQYATSKPALADILEGVAKLRETFLHHEDVNSAVLIEYKQDLQNLEIKTATHIDFSKI